MLLVRIYLVEWARNYVCSAVCSGAVTDVLVFWRCNSCVVMVWGDRCIRCWSEVEGGDFGGFVWLLGGMAKGAGVNCRKPLCCPVDCLLVKICWF